MVNAHPPLQDYPNLNAQGIHPRIYGTVVTKKKIKKINLNFYFYFYFFKLLFRVHLFRDFLQKHEQCEIEGTRTLGGLQYMG